MHMHERMPNLALLLVVASACGAETVSVGDASTSSGDSPPPTSSTTAPTTSSASSETTGSTGSSSSSTDDGADTSSSSETTSGAMPTGHARFFVLERTGVDARVHPVYREYADGELSEPTPLVADLPLETGVTSLAFAPAGTHFSYCVNGVDQECFARDLTAFPDSEGQRLDVDPVPSLASMTEPQWIEEWDAYFFAAAQQMPEAGGVYRAGFVDGVLATPEIVVDAVDGALPGSPLLSPDRAWISFGARRDADSPSGLFVITSDGVDPTAWTEVSDVVDLDDRLDAVGFLSDSQALLYRINNGIQTDADDALYLVDLGSGSPTPPGLRVDTPVADELGTRRPRIAPDDHAILYWVGSDSGLVGELMLVALDGSVPQTPIRISTATDGEAVRGDYDWSPDSRSLVYVARHADETWQAYVVLAPGATAAEPIAFTDALPYAPDALSFDADSRWLYFVADVEGDGGALFRVDVSGAQPGAPQRVSAPPSGPEWLTGEVIWSVGGTELLYTVEVVDPSMRQLWVVDVSGERPGVATRIDTLQGPPGVQFGSDLSPDASIVTFREQAEAPDDPFPLYLVDRSAPQQSLQVADDALGVVFLPD